MRMRRPEHTSPHRLSPEGSSERKWGSSGSGSSLLGETQGVGLYCRVIAVAKTPRMEWAGDLEN